MSMSGWASASASAPSTLARSAGKADRAHAQPGDGGIDRRLRAPVDDDARAL
jgi:hypothetical protein